MFDEASLKTALAELGYGRVERLVYQATWSTEVEHFLYFELHGTPNNLISTQCGIRTKAAEAFARKSIETYGSRLHRIFRDRIDPNLCATNFSLGKLASWDVTFCLDILARSGPMLVARIKRDIEQFLFPVIRDVTTPDRFLSLLLADAAPCPWVFCDGAMRAAMIALLAQRKGVQPGDVRRLLEPYKEQIGWALRDGLEPDPDAYIERIIEDAAAA